MLFLQTLSNQDGCAGYYTVITRQYSEPDSGR